MKTPAEIGTALGELVAKLTLSDRALRVAGGIVGAAGVGLLFLPADGILFKVCVGIVAAGVPLGIVSTTGREPRE